MGKSTKSTTKTETTNNTSYTDNTQTNSTTNITSEVDKEYNARLATIAEQQQDLSNQYFDWWKQVQAPLEQATAQAQLGLIPAQTEAQAAELGLATAQANASKSLVPQQTSTSQAQLSLAENQANAQNSLVPLSTDTQRSQLELQQQAAEGSKAMLPGYYAAAQIDPEVYAGRAATDVNRQLSNTQDQLARQQARMGVNPNSGAAQAAQRNSALQGAAAIAGAANNGRLKGEDINWQRMNSAIQYKG